MKAELEAYLRCGILIYGFARLRCAGCGQKQMLPFSCKSRAFCPSCTPRRMAETVTFIQRFGSLLQLDVHFHAWLLDGVKPSPDDDAVLLLKARLLAATFAARQQSGNRRGVVK